MSDLGNKIRMIRELKGFSQEYVAGQIGISQRAYSKLESGETKLDWERVTKIAAVFEIDPANLITFDETKIFNNCTQSGNNEQTINYHTSETVEKAYTDQIEALKAEIVYLREQNAAFLKLIDARLGK